MDNAEKEVLEKGFSYEGWKEYKVNSNNCNRCSIVAIIAASVTAMYMNGSKNDRKKSSVSKSREKDDDYKTKNSLRDEDEIDLAPDGAYVTVPNSADYVYTDGEDVIWSNTAFYDPGPGYDQIN